MIRATLWLSWGLLRRMLREGMVLRSLVFPPVIFIGTLLITALVFATMRPAPTLGVAADLPPQVRAEIEALAAKESVALIPVSNATDAVDNRNIAIAVGAEGIAVRLDGFAPARAEAVARRALHSSWYQVSPSAHVKNKVPPSQINDQVIRFMSVLFTYYGVVFGAGGVARDRSEGLIDAELGLPIPFWIHGAARWLTSSILLATMLVATIATINAAAPIPHPVLIAMHGIAACIAAPAIGLIVIGRSGLDRGFAVPLTIGLTTVSFLLAIGATRLPVANLLPIASVHAGHSPIVPIVVACLWGAVASWIFGKRCQA